MNEVDESRLPEMLAIPSKEPDAVAVKDNTKKNMRIYNAMKHGKYAKVPLVCNVCHHRAESAGGTGRCNVYEKDKACAIRKDLHDVISEYDTRDPEKLREITNEMVHLLTERVMFAERIAMMSDGMLDRETLQQANVLAKYIKLQSELGAVTLKATAKAKMGDNGNTIRELLQSVTVGKVG